MHKTITVDIFNPSSIDDAIKELNDFAKWVEDKAEELRRAVSTRLDQIIKEGFNGNIPGDFYVEGYKVSNVEVNHEDYDKFSLVIAYGEEAVFIEFGAGVYYNPGGSTHPDMPPQIKHIGTYGKGYGSRQIWGFYDADGTLHLTHGNPASMPMYLGLQQILEELPSIAKTVFGS